MNTTVGDYYEATWSRQLMIIMKQHGFFYQLVNSFSNFMKELNAALPVVVS